MKAKIIITLSIISIFLLQACDIYDPYKEVDYTPPAIPTGVVVKNGDGRADIFWNNNRESDLAGYNIYVSDSYDGRYELIGSSEYNNFTDYDAANGLTYYYAVTAYDFNGNESELSVNVVYATPRPEGFNQAIFDFRQFPNNSGYSFANYSVFPYDDVNTDFFFENYQGTFYLDVWDDTDIQDMGLTNSIYDIEYAPNSGWSDTKDALAVVGHTYVIWTWNNHFAKIRISQITTERVVFDWAYQLVEGEIQLKGLNSGGRKTLKRSTVR
ncbi:amylopullulanase precursor [bacterium BMS3Abin03]|nr:amylopullulanase precursor [bacterium BMS3Abin03]